jgi:signal peptidase I
MEEHDRLFKRHPVVAFLYSIIPGLGQWYNGQPAKAGVFMLLTLALIVFGLDGPLLATGLPGMALLLFLELGYRLFMTVEAVVTAMRLKAISLSWYNRLPAHVAVVVVACLGWSAGTNALLEHMRYRTFYIPSGAMEHTLEINDYVVVDTWAYRSEIPRRGDIVVFTPPPQAGAGKKYIKRVAGVPGDTVELRQDILLVNNQAVPDSGRFLAPIPASPNFSPTMVAQGTLFVLGDNRHNSADSRVWGLLPLENVTGRTCAIFFPPSRARVIPPGP